MAHLVTAALAVVRDVTGRTHYLYQGGMVPPGLASDEELDRLTGLGLLTAVGDIAPAENVEDLPPGHTPDDPDATPPTGTEPGAPPTAPAPVRPQQVAAKGLWVDYVVTLAEHHGDTSMTRERALKLSKDELIAYQPPTGS